MGGAKSIEIHQVKTFTTKQTVGQEPVGGVSCLAKQAAVFEDGQIGLQHRQPKRISVIRPETANASFKPVAQAAETTACHQIQHPRRPRLRQGASEQHPEIPGRPGFRIEKSFPRMKRGCPFHEGLAAVIHQAASL
jgi:hypothetical protein